MQEFQFLILADFLTDLTPTHFQPAISKIFKGARVKIGYRLNLLPTPLVYAPEGWGAIEPVCPVGLWISKPNIQPFKICSRKKINYPICQFLFLYQDVYRLVHCFKCTFYANSDTSNSCNSLRNRNILLKIQLN